MYGTQDCVHHRSNMYALVEMCKVTKYALVIESISPFTLENVKERKKNERKDLTGEPGIELG